MSRRPCHYYQTTKGCRNGKSCQFAHIELTGPGSVGSPGSSTARLNNPLPNATSTSQVPPGVCRYYWTSGHCKMEFGCHFRHTQEEIAHNSILSSPRGNALSVVAKEMIAPFLTEKGLAKISSNATDGFFVENDSSTQSPTDAHRILQRFLMDNYKFRISFDVYSFLGPLCSANPSNNLWVYFYLSISSKILLNENLNFRHKKKDRYTCSLKIEPSLNVCFVLTASSRITSFSNLTTALRRDLLLLIQVAI